jgi:acetolactate synthase-1/3 small subunit
MERFLQAQADYGVDTLLKVVGVLRRKEIGVTDVKMTSLPESVYSRLEIHLNENSDLMMDKAIGHLEKIIGLRDVRIGEA